MAYIGKEPASGIRNRFSYTATAGQTTFSGADDESRTLSYTDGHFTDVFLNGVKLDKSDYTATSGTSIVLDEGAAVNDVLEVLAFDTFSVFSGDFSADVTVGGDLTVDTNTLHVDSTNNRVGIGTTSPARELSVGDGTGSPNIQLLAANTGNSRIEFGDTDDSDVGEIQYLHGDNAMLFHVNASERMRIDSSGNLGIGTTSPNSKLHVTDSTDIDMSSAADGQFVIQGSGYTGAIALNATGMQIYHNSSSRGIIFGTNETERMRISSSGQLLIGTTTGISAGVNGWQFAKTSGASRYGASGTSSNILTFYTSSGLSGRISNNGTSTSYQTSSDYRLKENVTDISDGITRLKQLEPKRFNFVHDTSTTVDGFLAHQAQTVVPEAIGGTHNEVETWTQDEIDAGDAPANTSAGDNKLDGDGNTIPVYQGIDQSKLVPLLTAALQEAITKIEALETQNADFETRIAALEAV